YRGGLVLLGDLLRVGAAGGLEARRLGVLGGREPDLGLRRVVPLRAGHVVLHRVLVALDLVLVVRGVGRRLVGAHRALVGGRGLLGGVVGRGGLLGGRLLGDGLVLRGVVLGGPLGGGLRLLHRGLLRAVALQHQLDDGHGGVVALAGTDLGDA